MTPLVSQLEQLAFTSKLIDALRPFATLADQHKRNKDSVDVCYANGKGINVGHLRKAQELIEIWERNY